MVKELHEKIYHRFLTKKEKNAANLNFEKNEKIAKFVYFYLFFSICKAFFYAFLTIISQNSLF